MSSREIPVYFVGADPALAERLQHCYESIEWDPEYHVRPVFHSLTRHQADSGLPARGEGLVFIETSDDVVEESALILYLQQRNPRLQLVLLAEDDIDYFKVASRGHIGNILKKGRFDASVVRALTVRLATGNIFGFAPYFPNGYSLGPLIRTYAGTVDLAELIQDTYEFFGECVPEENQLHFRMFLHELLSNTFAYAIGGISPDERDQLGAQPPPRLFIPDRKGIKVSLAADAEKVGVSVQDSTGNLSLLRVLEKLRRQSRIGGETAPPGLLDETGRGISLVYRYSRLIVNILRGVRTETIFLQYHREEMNRYESIIVTEVAPLQVS